MNSIQIDSIENITASSAASASDNDNTKTSPSSSSSSLSSNNIQMEFSKAKHFLQKSSPISDDNLYDHLCEIVHRILLTRTENVIDFFEQFSQEIKEYRNKINLTKSFQDLYTPPIHFEYTNRILPLFLNNLEIEDHCMNKIDFDMNFMFHCYHEIGLDSDPNELFFVFLRLKELSQLKSIRNLRFWGKIFGRYQNYFIIEAELEKEEFEDPLINEVDAYIDEMNANNLFVIRENDNEKETSRKSSEISLVLNENITKTDLIENERNSTDHELNRKVYYVSNDLSNPRTWIRLPNVYPNQIVIARKILHYFTGNLQTKIGSSPKFPGTEKHYLRTQIARISSSTQISPIGYYKIVRESRTDRDSIESFDENEDDDEEEDVDDDEEIDSSLRFVKIIRGKTSMKKYKLKESNRNIYETIVKNSDYETLQIDDLSDSRLGQWVHHTPYINTNGSISSTASNLYEIVSMTGSSETRSEIDLHLNYPKKKLFRSISNDYSNETTCCWTIRKKAKYLQKNGLVSLRSNLWPGAITFANTRNFVNIYIGWGMKRYANFQPYVEKEFQNRTGLRSKSEMQLSHLENFDYLENNFEEINDETGNEIF